MQENLLRPYLSLNWKRFHYPALEERFAFGVLFYIGDVETQTGLEPVYFDTLDECHTFFKLAKRYDKDRRQKRYAEGPISRALKSVPDCVEYWPEIKLMTIVDSKENPKGKFRKCVSTFF